VQVDPAAEPDRGAFRPGFDCAALPTLMRKCWQHAQPHLEPGHND
jgi:hypothetical protein